MPYIEWNEAMLWIFIFDHFALYCSQFLSIHGLGLFFITFLRDKEWSLLKVVEEDLKLEHFERIYSWISTLSRTNHPFLEPTFLSQPLFPPPKDEVLSNSKQYRSMVRQNPISPNYFLPVLRLVLIHIFVVSSFTRPHPNWRLLRPV